MSRSSSNSSAIVARRVARLRSLADEITADHGVRVEILEADLAEEDAGTAPRARIDGPVDLLVKNAGSGTYGPVAQADPEALDRMVAIGIRTLIEATRGFLPELTERRHDGILDLASTAAYQPLPGMAAYAATKASVLSFTEAV